MCGISGIISFNRNKEVKPSHLRKMADNLIHRGPDDSGIYLNNSRTVGFGFRRLSIVDLDGGAQPMSDQDGQVSIVFNGEIYNHTEIRMILRSKGYQFCSSSDTEAIIKGYLEWGNDVVKYLRGMFAFALWDTKTNKLLVARDRLGVKPVYFFNDGESFIFASEIKAILSLPNISKILNEKSLYHYLTFAVSPAPDTMFKNIKKLKPGNFIEVSLNGSIKNKKYWEPIVDSFINDITEDEAIKKLRSLLRESIKLRMMSDVPVGAFLSGGIDSSLNVALMTEIMDRPVDSFSVAINNDKKSNELKYAKEVAKTFHTNHHEEIISNKDFIEFLPEMVKIQDEPIADPVCIPLYFVSKLARNSKTYVIQVGEGVDELFCGYSLYGTLENFNRSYYAPFSNFPYIIKKLLGSVGKVFLPEKKQRYFAYL